MPTKRYERMSEEELRELPVDNLLEYIAELRESATHDFLTGVLNRRGLHEELDHYLDLRERRSMPLALLLVDVDDFGEINEQYGHPAGDEALRHVAQSMVQAVRASDIVARFGGDEFVILLLGTDPAEAENVGEKIASEVNIHVSKVSYEGAVFEVQVTVGCIGVPPESITAEELLFRASKELLKQKSRKKKRRKK